MLLNVAVCLVGSERTTQVSECNWLRSWLSVYKGPSLTWLTSPCFPSGSDFFVGWRCTLGKADFIALHQAYYLWGIIFI